MSSARLKVGFAGPLVSVQDAGRFGQMRFGVPASGPMDRLAYRAAFAALGRESGACIEVSLGGLSLECVEGGVTFAVAGGGFGVDCNGAVSTGWTVQTLAAGQKLTLRAGRWGSWCYLAFAGDLQATHWLGSAATHGGSGFGGGAVMAGQVLEVTDAEVAEDRLGDLPVPDFAQPSPEVRVVTGPQEHRFEEASAQTFLSDPFRVSDAYDRMGMRLEGPKLRLRDVLSIPSEPVLRGSVQVSGDGVPTVLLADHQTTGGYPKIATVAAVDTDRLAQMRSKDVLRFRAVTPEEAIALSREEARQQAAYLEEIAKPRGSLMQRLMRENLISGVVGDAVE